MFFRNCALLPQGTVGACYAYEASPGSTMYTFGGILVGTEECHGTYYFIFHFYIYCVVFGFTSASVAALYFIFYILCSFCLYFLLSFCQTTLLACSLFFLSVVGCDPGLLLEQRYRTLIRTVYLINSHQYEHLENCPVWGALSAFSRF